MSAIVKAKGIGWAIALAVKNFIRDDGSALAGYMAYTALLALFPFLIFATALCGLAIGTEGVEPVMNFLFNNLPPHVARTIRPVLEEVVRNRSGNVLSLSAIGAIWIASNGFEALRAGLERAYLVKNYRSWWKNRLISIGFVFLAFVAFVALSVLIVFGPSLTALAREYSGAVEYVEEFFGVNLQIWVLVTVVLWMILASAFSIYFRFVPSYAITYGTLGGVIATLLFFYVSAAVFIFGAEINAATWAEADALDEANKTVNKADSAPLI